MSYFDDASLAFLPSGAAGKDGKAYSIKPEDGTGDFTFTRGSNLAATRVGADGLIEKGRENLLLQSNQFDTSWIKAASLTLTSGQSGYNGTNDAWKLESNGASGYDVVYQTVSISGVNTYSIYAKAGTNTNFALRSLSNVDARANFDLSAGSVSISGTIDASIVSVGGDWYRCSLTFSGSNNAVYVYPNSLGAASAGYIYIQSAQLEQSLVSTEYIETTTTTGTAGILEDTPRFNYSFGASCPSLLLEPSRTNLVPSEYFGAVYTLSDTAIINNNTTSPEGLQNATKIYPTASGNYKHIRYSSLNPSTGVHTFSIFAKAGELDHLVLIDSDGGGVGVDFDLSTGVASDSASVAFDFVDMVDYGNGWYRCVATATNPRFVWILSDNGGVSVTANGTDGLYIYGAQAELASYPTSYIPNNSGGTITRAAEVCGGAGDANTFNSTEGVLYAEISALADDGTNRRISLNDGSDTNRINLMFTSTSNEVVCNYKVSGTTQVSLSNVLSDVADTFKIAFKYLSGDFALFVNGVKVDTDSNTTMITANTLDNLDFLDGAGLNNFYGNVKQVLTFNTALTDSELATLTTL